MSIKRIILSILLFVSLHSDGQIIRRLVFNNPFFTCAYMNTEVCAWSTATGITDVTTLKAIDTLIKQLKDSSLWSLGKLINPVAGGTSTSHAYNVKDTGTFKIAFSGTITHAATGMTSNGTTGYGNTGLDPNTTYPSGFMSIGIYSRTNADGVQVDIGALSATNRYVQIYSRFGNTFYAQVNTNNSISENTGNTDSRGWFLGSRTGSTATVIQKNGTATTSAATSTAVESGSIYVLCQNNAGVASFFSTREIAFVWIGDALTTTQAVTLYNIVQAYETRMSRQL